MARDTYYVVLTFTEGEDGVIADEPREARSAEAAQRAAESFKSTKAGVIAFSRAGDFELGEFEDAVVLVQHGKLPDDVLDMFSEPQL